MCYTLYFATEVPVQLGLQLNLQVFATLKYRLCHAEMQAVTPCTAENLLTVQLKLQGVTLLHNTTFPTDTLQHIHEFHEELELATVVFKFNSFKVRSKTSRYSTSYHSRRDIRHRRRLVNAIASRNLPLNPSGRTMYLLDSPF